MTRCRDCVASLLGACRGEFCYTERAALVERAGYTASQLGHELTEFTKIEKRPAWRARCTHCGLQATITIDPEPDQPPICGDAVSIDCPTPGHGES